jgi:hypothetical protein
VRVRQRDLAPQLREDPGPAGAVGPAADSRSPDAAGRVMSAFWEGRARGLAESEPEQAAGADRRENGGDR